MAEIIKKGLKVTEPYADTQIEDWSESKGKDGLHKRKRIIKAKEAVFTSEGKEIPHMKIAPEGTTVKPLRNGLHVEGAELVCQCGEKTVIYFDFEDERKHE